MPRTLKINFVQGQSKRQKVLPGFCPSNYGSVASPQSVAEGRRFTRLFRVCIILSNKGMNLS